MAGRHHDWSQQPSIGARRADVPATAATLCFFGILAVFVAAPAPQRAPDPREVLATAQVALSQDGRELLVLDTAPGDMRICPVKDVTAPRLGCITATQLRERAR